MDFFWFLRSVTFVVRFLSQCLGCDVCLRQQQSRGGSVFFKKKRFLAFVVKVVPTKAP